jgi:predicted GIY-YIG superfamily endonuclease
VLRRRIGRRELALRVEHAVKRLPKAGKEALLGRRDLLSRLVRRTRAGVAGFAGRRDVR